MSSYYELTNTPTIPVSLSDAKDFLRVDFTKDDSVITNMIAAAVKWGETYTGRDFSSKNWTGLYDGLCVSSEERYPFLPLERSPVTSVTQVRVSSGGSYAVNTDYIRKKRTTHDRLLFTTTPNIDTSVSYAFEVTFVSGYASLPAGLREAILEMVSFLYENRGDVPSNAPNQIKMMFSPFRIVQGYW